MEEVRATGLACGLRLTDIVANMLNNEELTEVVRREQQMLDPAIRASGARVLELLHPDFVEYGASGQIWDRTSIIAALSAEPGVSREGTNFSPVALADNVVLLTYRIMGKSGSLRSSVWIKDLGSDWRIRFHQRTSSTTNE